MSLADLIFSISQENRKDELFLIVQARFAGSSRLVYGTDLQALSKTDKVLASLLLQELSVGKGRNSLDTVSCEKISIKQEKSLAVLQELIRSKRLQWKNGTSLFFNPLGKSTVEIIATHQDRESLVLSGHLIVDGDVYLSSDITFLFLGQPIWGIVKQRVFCLGAKTKPSWIMGLYPENSVLKGKARDSFLENAKDPYEGFPSVVFSGEETIAKERALAVFPLLLLRDAYGAFADLCMEYENFSVDFLSNTQQHLRNLTAEKEWEKDLLETGFIRKQVGESQYYCPMDQVPKTLSFLLDLGWKILDSNGKKVCKMTDSSLTFEESGNHIYIKGSFEYGAHAVNLTNVVGSFTRKKQFVDLTSDSVGWLGSEKILEEVELFFGSDEENTWVGDTCVFSKKRVSCLEDFAPHSASAKSLLDRLTSVRYLEQDSASPFEGKLYPYQEEGKKWLQFLYSNQFSGLLADEMGLGKTVQVLSFLSSVSWQKPLLIVVPTSLLFNWQREWEKFLPHKSLHVHSGIQRGGKECLERQEAILTSYALLRIDHLLFSQINFAFIGLDEAQWIKNPDSQTAKVCCSLKADMRLCLSGTPVENKTEDLWSLFHFLEPELLGERRNFLSQLAIGDIDGRYRKRIRKKIRPFILRRKKEEVAKDLPEKIEQTIFIEMKESQRAFYEDWLVKTRKGLLQKVYLEGAKAHRMEILEAILRLRQICVDPYLVDREWAHVQTESSAKMERVLEDLIEAVSQGRKILVYSQFTQFLKMIEKRIQALALSYVYLDGDTKDRESVVSAFQSDGSVPIFLLSLKAGGVGLNLTAADYVFLCDPWWNESVERQAIDRAHRLGRKHTVVARRYVMVESVEEKIMKMKAHKNAMAEGLLEQMDADPSLFLDEMVELLS